MTVPCQAGAWNVNKLVAFFNMKKDLKWAREKKRKGKNKDVQLFSGKKRDRRIKLKRLLFQ